jgi:hypothetical protein
VQYAGPVEGITETVNGKSYFGAVETNYLENSILTNSDADVVVSVGTV